MTALRRLAAFAAIVAATTPARPDDFVPGVHGTQVPNGGRFTTALFGMLEPDVDDYVVLVERGRTLTATIAAERHSILLPTVDVVRSDDSVALTLGGDSPRVRLRFTADATDAYRVRVRAPAGDFRYYSVAIAVTGRVATDARDAVPGEDGRLRFLVPARGGARVSASLRWRGTAPAPVGVTSPTGESMPAIAAAFRPGRGSLTLSRFALPEEMRFGDLAFTFSTDAKSPPTDVRFAARVMLPRTKAPRLLLRSPEPSIGTPTPSFGIAGGQFLVGVQNMRGPADVAIVRIGSAVAKTRFDTPAPLLRVLVPDGLAPGTYELTLTTTTAQMAVAPVPFVVVPPPVVTSVEPAALPAAGGVEVTIRGAGFRPGRMGVRIGGDRAALVPTASTATSVTFVAPRRDPRAYTVGVVDLDLGVDADARTAVRWEPWTWAGTLSPPLVSVLGGETVSVDGAWFAPTDRVWLETATEGVFEEIHGSWRTASRREFIAPMRPRGAYDFVIEDAEGHRSAPVPLTFFSFAEATAPLRLERTAGFEATTTATGDFDGDGDEDLVLARSAGGPAVAASQTRVLRNDGAAGLVDVTASALPEPTAADDWRAERVRLADVDGDGRLDLVLATNDPDVPAAGSSHVRILVNESGAATGERVFRDRTAALMAPVRSMTSMVSGTRPNDVDDWRARDLWIGDLDGAGGPPDLVATTDRTFENQYVACTPYCGSPYGGGYPYSFYWGGTRVFRWDAAARGGLGRFAFDPFRLPRRAALTDPLAGAPPQIEIPRCNAATPCAGTFTPFTGERLAVGRVDGDAHLDVAVLATTTPTVNGAPASALQVTLLRSRTAVVPDVDATSAVTALGVDLRGDAVAIGDAPWSGGSGGRLLAAARASPGSGSALRLFRHVAGADPAQTGTFEDLTGAALPTASGAESWQADDLAFLDVDLDGDDDLALLSRSRGLRLLRSVGLAGGGGPFAPYAGALVDAASPDPFVGGALTLGDLDGNGLLDFVVAGRGATRVLAAVR
jgi:hypothetical protein